MGARIALSVAVLLFVVSLMGGRRWLYWATAVLGVATLLSLAPPPPSQASVAHEEITGQTALIDAASALTKRAHAIVENIPRTKNESRSLLRKNGEVDRFYHDEQAWLTRAEQGKPLDAFVEQRASTAAIRIIAVDNFLTGAVQSAIERCDDHDSALNLALADKIVADARASLAGNGNPHFPTPDLSRSLDNSNNCIDTEQAP